MNSEHLHADASDPDPTFRRSGVAPVADDMLEVSVATVGDATVLTVRGEVDMHTAPALAGGLRDALARSTPVLVVDLDGISFLASTGLSELIRASQQATRQGAVLRLAGGPRGVLRAIAAAGLTDVFEHHESVESAV